MYSSDADLIIQIALCNVISGFCEPLQNGLVSYRRLVGIAVSDTIPQNIYVSYTSGTFSDTKFCIRSRFG